MNQSFIEVSAESQPFNLHDKAKQDTSKNKIQDKIKRRSYGKIKSKIELKELNTRSKAKVRPPNNEVNINKIETSKIRIETMQNEDLFCFAPPPRPRVFNAPQLPIMCCNIARYYVKK